MEVSAHPLGVQTMGSVMLRSMEAVEPPQKRAKASLTNNGRSATPRSPMEQRRRGLGHLAPLEDSTLLSIVQCLDGWALMGLAQCSEWWFCWTQGPDLWKTLVLSHLSTSGGSRLTFADFADVVERDAVRAPPGSRGSDEDCHGALLEEARAYYGWKRCFLCLHGKSPSDVGSLGSQPLLRFTAVVSDLLHHTHMCTCAGAALPKAWCSRDNAEHVDAATLTPEAFRVQYEEPNKPVVLTNCAFFKPGTPFHDTPPTVEAFVRRFSECRGHVAGYEMKLSDYATYMRESARFDDVAMYLFDKGFDATMHPLAQEYAVPHVFADDLFGVLQDPDPSAQKPGRPDYRWLIMGPERSGSSFHIDPNNTSAWNACLSGSKKWILFPPDVVPPGVHPSVDGSELATPLSLTEWFIGFYREAARMRPVEAVTRPGEVMFVPRGWWHMVVNLSDSIAVTQNYVSRVNLPQVLDYLEHQPHNISGCPVEDRPSLYGRFVTALRNKRPDLLEDAERRRRTCAAQVAPADTDGATSCASAEKGRSLSSLFASSSLRMDCAGVGARSHACTRKQPGGDPGSNSTTAATEFSGSVGFGFGFNLTNNSGCGGNGVVGSGSEDAKSRGTGAEAEAGAGFSFGFALSS